jgi:hypothetical protein
VYHWKAANPSQPQYGRKNGIPAGFLTLICDLSCHCLSFYVKTDLNA